MNGELQSIQLVVTIKYMRGWLYRNMNLVCCHNLSPTWVTVVREEGHVFSSLLVDGIVT